MPRVNWTGAVAGEARAKFEAVRPKRRTGLAGGAGVCRSQRASCISSSAECTGSASVCWRVLHGEVVVLDLEGDGAAEQIGSGHALGDPLGDRPQRIEHRVGRREIGREGLLGADRLVRPVGADLALVLAARDPEIVAADLAEAVDQLGLGAGAQIGAVVDAGLLHLARGDRADAEEALDRQPRDERLRRPRAGSREAVGLVHVGGDLGQELVERHPGRGGEPGPPRISRLIARAIAVAAGGPRFGAVTSR